MLDVFVSLKILQLQYYCDTMSWRSEIVRTGKCFVLIRMK